MVSARDVLRAEHDAAVIAQEALRAERDDAMAKLDAMTLRHSDELTKARRKAKNYYEGMREMDALLAGELSPLP